MKINKIELGCRQTSAVAGEVSGDCCLYLFRTPVVYNVGIAERVCEKSSIIMYNSNRRQYFRPKDGGIMKYDKVEFRPSAADKQYAAAMNILFDVPVELRDDFVIASVIKSMKVRYGMIGSRNYEFMDLAMRMIFLCIGDVCGSDAELVPERDISKYKQLKALREDIYDSPAHEWSIKGICDSLGLSKTYFHRLYLKAFGVTCRQDIIESRLVCAEKLLMETDLSLSEIAEKCGYDSDSYFMRQFKLHRGLTPTEFRRMKR